MDEVITVMELHSDSKTNMRNYSNEAIRFHLLHEDVGNDLNTNEEVEQNEEVDDCERTRVQNARTSGKKVTMKQKINI